MKASALETAILFYIRAAKLPTPQVEFPFAESLGRKWRADFAYPEHMLLIEVQGGGWIQGRHNTGTGFEKDCEKLSAAAVLGYRVIHLTAKSIEDGTGIAWIREALERSKHGAAIV